MPRASPELVEIPTTSFGIIDTIKLVLRTETIHHKDLEALRADASWTERRNAGSKKYVLGQSIRAFGASTEFHREFDGCRLKIRTSKIEVEVSLPRVLGLNNDEQAELSEEDVVAAVKSITSGLFPKTTLRAKWSSPRSFWFVTRLDVAVNFQGDIQEFVESLRHARRPRSSTKPEAYSDAGITFYGTDYSLLLYDPGKKLPRGRLSAQLRGRSFRKANEPRVRVEFRYQTQRALRRLLLHFGRDIRGVPFLITRADKSVRIACFHLDHNRLHQLLATEVRSLRGSTVVRSSSSRKTTYKTRCFLLYLIEHPECWAEVEANYMPDTVRKFRNQIHSLKISELRLDIVELVWNCPRLSGDHER